LGLWRVESGSLRLHGRTDCTMVFQQLTHWQETNGAGSLAGQPATSRKRYYLTCVIGFQSTQIDQHRGSGMQGVKKGNNGIHKDHHGQGRSSHNNRFPLEVDLSVLPCMLGALSIPRPGVAIRAGLQFQRPEVSHNAEHQRPASHVRSGQSASGLAGVAAGEPLLLSTINLDCRNVTTLMIARLTLLRCR
jgi:hypothetical protein